MISLRKTLFTLLAPLGAATIIGTGFATWVFGIQEPTVVGGPINNNVAVTPEVTNEDIKILTCPSLLVFSEGNQGQSNLFDGISFYSDKTVVQGKEFNITIPNNSNHRLSLVYDNTTTTVKKMYFSWKETSGSTRLVTGELTNFIPSSSPNDADYVGTWTGDVIYENQNIEVTLTINEGGNASIELAFSETSKIKADFEYEEKEKTSSTIPKITVTDSTFAFRYTYDNKDLVDEYHLNVKMKLGLESRNPFEFRFVADASEKSLLYNHGHSTNFKLSKEDSGYSLLVNLNSTKLTFNITSFPNTDNSSENFPEGDYLGSTDNGISCTLKYNPNTTDVNNSTISIGNMDMDYYLSIIDLFKNRCDKDGYFNILLNKEYEDYAETALHIDIDRTHIKDEKPYIDFTCQLANYLRYASPEVKPINYDRYLKLAAASVLGRRGFRITVSADFTAI